MRIAKDVARFFLALSLAAGLAGTGAALAADQPATGEKVPSDLTRELKEMPVLTGEEWQTLDPETKVAFIWGVGHVVTISEHVVQRHPELKKPDFTAKLAEGLRGVPMNTIIERLDAFYRDNPDDLDLPVMRVIWSQLVKPKLQTGIADRPFQNQNRQ